MLDNEYLDKKWYKQNPPFSQKTSVALKAHHNRQGFYINSEGKQALKLEFDTNSEVKEAL